MICRVCIIWKRLLYWRWILKRALLDWSNILKVTCQEYSAPHGTSPPPGLMSRCWLSKMPRPRRSQDENLPSPQRTNTSKLWGNATFRLTLLLISNYQLLILDFGRSSEGRDTKLAGLIEVLCEKGNNLHRSLSKFTPLSCSWDTVPTGLITLAGVPRKLCELSNVCNHTEASAPERRELLGSVTSHSYYFHFHLTGHWIYSSRTLFFSVIKHDKMFHQFIPLGSIVKFN